MKNILRQWSKIGRMALLAGAVSMLTGCATSRLWQATGEHHYQPFSAEPPQVLHDAANDALMVVCRQYCDNRQHGVHNRQIGYWLRASSATATRPGAGESKPVKAPGRLRPLAVYTRYAMLPSTPKTESSYAVYDADQGTLTIHLPAGKMVTHTLPTTFVKTDTVARIFLVLPAAAADTAGVAGIVGGTATVGAAEAMAYSYMPYYYRDCPENKNLGSPTVALVKHITK